MLDGPHHTSDSLDISSISRDPLREINILNSPSTMHTFETFRKARVITTSDAPSPVPSSQSALHTAADVVVSPTVITAPSVPPPAPPKQHTISVASDPVVDEKLSLTPNGDLSLEKEIMAALNSCRVSIEETLKWERMTQNICLYRDRRRFIIIIFISI